MPGCLVRTKKYAIIYFINTRKRKVWYHFAVLFFTDMAVTLTKRLATIAELVRGGAYFADVGTDHGYLPVWLVQNGRISRAIAADINAKPLASAQKTIEKHHLEQQIVTICSDGLENVDPSVEDIAIAGMGGELIAQIIGRAEWIKNPQTNLLLQPMTQAAHLRRYLAENGFAVLREQPAQEGRRLYIVLQACWDGKKRVLSDAEALAGRCLEQTDELSQRYLKSAADKQRKIAAGLKTAENFTEAKRREALAEELERFLLK